MKKDWKGCPPRVRRIGVVDDDADSRKTLVELIENEFPLLTVRGFETIFDAYQGITSYDYLLIDVSAVAPQMLTDVNRAWGPIGKFAESYPGTNFIITSAMSRNAVQDVIDDCINYGKVEKERLSYGGFMWESKVEPVSVKATLHRLIKPEDMVWTKCNNKRLGVKGKAVKP